VACFCKDDGTCRGCTVAQPCDVALPSYVPYSTVYTTPGPIVKAQLVPKNGRHWKEVAESCPKRLRSGVESSVMPRGVQGIYFLVSCSPTSCSYIPRQGLALYLLCSDGSIHPAARPLASRRLQDSVALPPPALVWLGAMERSLCLSCADSPARPTDHLITPRLMIRLGDGCVIYCISGWRNRKWSRS